ncbi:hypothetical protein LINPERPRIM_LOCUS26368 [Linum perenne]
MIGSWCSTTIC